MTIIASTWQRNDIRNVDVARRCEYPVWTSLLHSENDAKNLDASIITSPWQRNNISKAEVANVFAVAAAAATVERELYPLNSTYITRSLMLVRNHGRS